MIKSLLIKNYALIQHLEMRPSSRLNVITGETGAGKSIMLGAVGLLLGNRADKKVLFDTSEKCVVESIFDLTDYDLQPVFDTQDLDYEAECVIRREISPNGKSRAFINDTPVNLDALKAVGNRLMDVHSQHESLSLGDQQYQLSVIDAFASHPRLIQDYRDAYNVHKRAERQLLELKKRAAQSTEDQDYKSFLLKELEDANLDELNQVSMEQELEVLENAEEIKVKLSRLHQLLDESDFAILQQLKESITILSSIAVSAELEEAVARLDSASIELADLSNELDQIQDRTEYKPERIAELKDQLDLLYRLQKKHGVMEVGALKTKRDGLSEELLKVANLDQDIANAQTAYEKSLVQVKEVGNKLSESRKLSSINLADEVEKVIHQIGIENGRIVIEVNQADQPQAEGLDTVEIFFSANKGISPQPLKEVASGGEFSRLIFAIKYLIANKIALPTIIFDEIETGVSGEVALQMIKMMQRMARNHQVVSISHLPQFAAGGDQHYFVYKDHSEDRSISRIKALVGDERTIEIAKMIGGAQPGQSAIESAKELLST